MSPLAQFALPTAYESLLADGTEWFTCAYGTAGSCAVGFRGTYDAISHIVNMFDNHDYQVPTPEQPNPIPRSRARWLACGPTSGFAYLTMVEERFTLTIERWLYCEILRLGEIDIAHEVIDTDVGDEDESWLAGLSARDLPGTEDYSDYATAWVEGSDSPVLASVTGEHMVSYISTFDDAAVTALAKAYAARFMAERVTIASFIPAPTQTIFTEYAVGHHVSDATQGTLETLVEEAAK